MASSIEKQIITTHILLKSKGKCKQTMKLGQLIEQNMRFILLENGVTKLILAHFLKTTTVWNFKKFFSVYPNRGLPKCIIIAALNTYFYLICSFFEKQKVIYNQFHCLIYCIIFEASNFPRSLKCICLPVDDAINFKINLSFLVKTFSHLTKKVRAKIQIS